MSQAEGFEIALLEASNGITAFNVYIYFTFGYLVAAYLAGKLLSSAQLVILNSLYLVAAFSSLFSLSSNMAIYGIGAARAGELWPAGYLYNDSFWIGFMSVIYIAGMIASLYFMRSVRRSS